MIEKITIDSRCYQKIMHWINKTDNEVSGLGKIQVLDNSILVTDAMLLPQFNGRAHTDIEPEDVALLEFQLKDTPGNLRFWWHSHVNMDVFWSKQDKDTQIELAKGGWFLSTVFNKRQQMRSSICTSRPVPVFCDNIPTEIIQFLPEETIKKWDDEFDLNVKDMIKTPTLWDLHARQKKSIGIKDLSVTSIAHPNEDGVHEFNGLSFMGFSYEEIELAMNNYDVGYDRAIEILQAFELGEIVPEEFMALENQGKH